MKIRNNTDRTLAFYFGDVHKEEPEGTITLKVGEDFDLDKCPKEDISIQER